MADRERRNGTMEASTSSPNNVIGSIPTSRGGSAVNDGQLSNQLAARSTAITAPANLSGPSDRGMPAVCLAPSGLGTGDGRGR